MIKSIAAALIAGAFALGGFLPQAALASGGTTVMGRIVAIDGGLPVSNATVELEHGTAVVGKTTTAADGSFSFPNEAPGVYNLQVAAAGYQTTVSGDVIVLGNESQVSVNLALGRSTTGIRTIAAQRVSGNSSLQTSATINDHLDPSILQAQNYMRSGDALGTLPFVNTSTSSSLGDDLSISIRGFDASETATLLDGHPVGPIGAFGSGYDFQLSPFWGLGSMNVVYGSGATGLYGVPTIAGSIDFQTLNPTRDPHYSFTQGIGDYGRALTGMTATGRFGKLGYAMAYGVQGTSGELYGNPTQWNLLIDPSQCDANSPDAGLPSIKRADIQACSYPVTGNYLLRNAVGKLTYDFSPSTQVLVTAYNATMWADSTGNGDTDFVTNPEMNFANPTAPATNSQTLPSGANVTCNNSYVVLNDSAQGYTCMSASQYNQTFTGPAGGGLGRFHAGLQQDYHGRVTQQIGPTSFILDGYVDNYNFDNVKGPGNAHHYNDIYRTHGLLASDDYATGKHDISGGVFLEHQQHVGQDVGKGTTFPDLQLTMSNYFVRDAWSPNTRFTTFLDMTVQRSHDTATTSFDPRLSFLYRPTSNDVIRVAGGRSSSVPDPSIMFGGLQFGAWQSYNPTCGNSLDSIGSGNNPALKPETANDYEVAYGHRFTPHTIVQADFYNSIETDPLVSGVFPLSTVPAADQPSDLASFVAKLQAHCGASFDESHFGVSEMFNAGSARYRGFDLTGSLGVTPDVTLDAEYAVQSAAYFGMNDNILTQNPTLINGQQLSGIPLQRASFGIGYADPSGIATRIDGYWIGTPNGFHRPPYSYANFNISKTFQQQYTINIGVQNLFNTNVQQYGLIGLGTFQPQNAFGDPSATALSEGSEEFGLAPRQIMLSLSSKI